MHPKATKPRGPPAIHSILARVPLDADACGVVPAQTDFPHRVIEPRELRRGRVLLVPLRTLAVPVEAPHHKSTLARDRGRVVRPRRDQGDPVAQRVGLQPVDDARLVAAHFFPMPQLAEVATAPTGHIATLKDGEAMFGPRRQAPHLQREAHGLRPGMRNVLSVIVSPFIHGSRGRQRVRHALSSRHLHHLSFFFRHLQRHGHRRAHGAQLRVARAPTANSLVSLGAGHRWAHLIERVHAHREHLR
mmetsp:Transcript_1782/g.7752  ORF Transcript_1782/g.7752 Transcript_1782/m.7752 type:complete len:246 (+) Transcript_1782:1593-2330(+)